MVREFTGLSARQERIEGITNPSIRIGGGVLLVGNGQVLTDVNYCELLVDIENLKPGGLCSLSVILDPTYEGSMAQPARTCPPLHSSECSKNTKSLHEIYEIVGTKTISSAYSGKIPIILNIDNAH